MSFDNITQVEQHFLRGGFGASLPDELEVSGIKYRLNTSTPVDHWMDLLTRKRVAMVSYTLIRNDENMARFEKNHADDAEDYTKPQTQVIFAWGVSKSLAIVPSKVQFVPRTRKQHIEVKGLGEGVEIGYDEDIIIHNINNNQPIQGKIDTGADTCSLHAEHIRVQGDSVTFQINGHQYNMPLFNMQTIKQADSNNEQRPSVKLTFQIADQTIVDIECNLNDRSGMSPLLIGKNLLSQGDFSIQTLQSEPPVESLSDDDWALCEAAFEGMEIPNTHIINEDEVKRTIEFMLQSNVSLQDVIHHIKEASINLINEDISY